VDLSTATPILILAVAVVTAIAGVACGLRRRSAAGVALLVPLPLVVAVHLLAAQPGTGDLLAFFVALAAFAVGAFVLCTDADDGEPPSRSDVPGEPPWWPQFEAAFRAYASSRRRPAAGRRPAGSRAAR